MRITAGEAIIPAMSRASLPTVRHVLAVASGKGGVGKTTVTVQLALALARAGRRVGIFDADVYGPNIPALLGVHRRVRGGGYVAVVRRAGAPATIPPLRRHGLSVMSVGLLLAEDQAINPLAETAGQLVTQTMRDVIWGDLDVLLVDLPPSAGQPQQTLLDQGLLDAVVLVTTPQDMSLLDAGRSLQLFRQGSVRVLGLVENMAYFVCPGCGEAQPVFARSAAWRSGVVDEMPILARIPLAAEVTRVGNSGGAAGADRGGARAEFDTLAETVWQGLAGDSA